MKDKKTVTRESLAENISESFQMKFGEAYKCVDDIINCISDALLDHKNVKISMLGSWKVKHKKARIGRNPKTLKEHEISERDVIQFRLSPAMRKKLNESTGII